MSDALDPRHPGAPSAAAVRFIVTDFDGTLHSDLEFPPVPLELQRLIADFQAAGGRWMINTGRDLPGVLEAIARAHLPTKPDFLGLVEREIYVRDGARYAPLEEWNDACARDQAAAFAALKPDLPEFGDWISRRFTATIYADAYSPFCVIAESNPDMDAIVAYLEAYCQRMPSLAVVRNDVYARFSHSGYHKGTVMSCVAQRLGLAPENVLAAGDHFNDLPMLDAARAACLVAPANAVPEVQEAVRRQGGFVSRRLVGWGVAEGLRYYLNGAQ